MISTNSSSPQPFFGGELFLFKKGKLFFIVFLKFFLLPIIIFSIFADNYNYEIIIHNY